MADIEQSSTRQRSRSAVRPFRHSLPGEDDKVQLTLVVLGAPKVGKSALVSQFLWSHYPTEYSPTVEDFNWIEYDVTTSETQAIHQQALLLEVIDTSGSRDFLAMRNLYTSTGDAFVVVFSVDNLASFEEAKTIIAEIRARNCKNAPILLIGNKMDLLDKTKKTKWPEMDVNEYLLQQRILFANLSAKDTLGVELTFGRLLERLRNRRCCGRPVLTKRRQSMPSKEIFSDINLSSLYVTKKRSSARCVMM
ncbi:hypothetical protein L596_010939 [Steinernema carpocapsae]|uniref:Uncharacterized protein n=1 Tax=Steinernema carpocapsae TaxID=34508 RepID=A0A4U5PK34_STECR|nr:hypothetical protein L596_010939 [Steinernema carpocapsae]